MARKIVGILGGMGPASTAELYLQVMRATPITREQDHLRVIVDSNPKVPDRTEVIRSGDTAAAIRELCRTARNLERAGAEVIGIPCNTAHAFLAEIRESVDVAVLDMVDEAARRARELAGEGAVAGLLATDGTLATGLYGAALARHRLRALAPGADAQAAVMAVIGEVKLGGVAAGHGERLAPAVAELTGAGAGLLVAACTEISLVFSRQPPEIAWLDPLAALAAALVREALGNEPPARTPELGDPPPAG